MTPTHRPRQLAAACLTAVLVLVLAACSQEYPNSTFEHNSDFNLAIDELWDLLLFWGTLVFVLVEGVLIYTIFKYRRREGHPEPKHVHGNTTLEILWTAIPAVILVFIAVPTVRTIFITQGRAVPEALQVEVVGHQWWWEFRYPEFTRENANGTLDTLTTANELYLPIGRTVNFALTTRDVLHSFWIPQMGGKRDLVANHTNYLWFTPDSTLETSVWNGFCAEYCGESHANMKFRAFTVTPAQFEQWVALQLSPAAFGATAPAVPPTDSAAAAADSATAPAPAPPPPGAGQAAGPTPATLASGTTQTAPGGYTFPREQMPAWAVPSTPVPDGLTFDDALEGDPARGVQAYNMSCIGCHAIAGNRFSISRIGPNLTHVGSRTTLGAGLYPNDAWHLKRWIKNARVMKPGAIMQTFGAGQIDPATGTVVTRGALSDQQIADIVAYLMALQ